MPLSCPRTAFCYCPATAFHCPASVCHCPSTVSAIPFDSPFTVCLLSSCCPFTVFSHLCRGDSVPPTRKGKPCQRDLSVLLPHSPLRTTSVKRQRKVHG